MANWGKFLLPFVRFLSVSPRPTNPSRKELQTSHSEARIGSELVNWCQVQTSIQCFLSHELKRQGEHHHSTVLSKIFWKTSHLQVFAILLQMTWCPSLQPLAPFDPLGRWKQELDGAAKYWVIVQLIIRHHSHSPQASSSVLPSFSCKNAEPVPVVAMGAVCAQASLPTKEVLCWQLDAWSCSIWNWFSLQAPEGWSQDASSSSPTGGGYHVGGW